MEGLREDIEVVKEPGKVYAIRADGRRQALSDLEAEDAAARRARFGTLSPELFERLNAVSDNEAFPVGVHFIPQLNWKSVLPGLSDSDLAKRALAKATLDRAVAEQGAALAAKLRRLGFVDLEVSNQIPVVFAKGNRKRIVGLASRTDLGVATITDNVPHCVVQSRWAGKPQWPNQASASSAET
jgi:hypothetical protein